MWHLIVLLTFCTSQVLAIVPRANCRFDESFDQCFKEFITTTIPVLADYGIPEADIPALEPLQVSEMSGNLNSVLISGQFTFHNIFVKGFRRVQIEKFQTNILEFDSNNVLLAQLNVFLPSLFVKASWNSNDLVVMGERISESGEINVSADNVRVKLNCQGRLVRLNETHYYPEMTKVSIDTPDIKSLKVQATNIIKNNPEMSKNIIAMINSYWEVLYQEFSPFINKVVNDLGTLYMNNYFSKFLPLRVSEVERLARRNG